MSRSKSETKSPFNSESDEKPMPLFVSRRDFEGLVEAYRTLLTALVTAEEPARRAKLLSLLAILEGKTRG